MDAGNILKPALARGELHIVGATTLEEYRANREGRGAGPPLPADPGARADRRGRGARSCAGCATATRRTTRSATPTRRCVAAVELSDRYLTDRLPARQGDRPDRPGRRPGAAAVAARRAPTCGRWSARSSSCSRDKDQAVAAEHYEQAAAAARPDRRAAAARSRTRRRGAPADARQPGGHRRGDRRGRVPADRHPGQQPHPGGEGPAARRSRSTCTSGSSARTRPSRPSPRRCGAPAPGSPTRPARSAASCSSARPASARPSWPGRSPRRCSAARTGWSAST